MAALKKIASAISLPMNTSPHQMCSKLEILKTPRTAYELVDNLNYFFNGSTVFYY